MPQSRRQKLGSIFKRHADLYSVGYEGSPEAVYLMARNDGFVVEEDGAITDLNNSQVKLNLLKGVCAAAHGGQEKNLMAFIQGYQDGLNKQSLTLEHTPTGLQARPVTDTDLLNYAVTRSLIRELVLLNRLEILDEGRKGLSTPKDDGLLLRLAQKAARPDWAGKQAL